MEEIKNTIKEKMNQHMGVMKTSQLYEECSLSYRTLNTLRNEEFLIKVKNGYYKLKEDERTEEEIICSLFRDSVLCLDSALYYHGYINDKPFEWHLAVDKNTSKSRFLLDYPIVIPYYTEPRVLEIGVTTVSVCGVEMKIYDKDRMICDVLKYEHKMDHEIFKQALKSYILDPEKDVHHLLYYAKERKVTSKVQSMIGVWL